MDGGFDPEYREAWTRRQVEDALILGNCHYALAGPSGAPLSEPVAAQPLPTAGFTLSRCTFGEEELLLIAVLPQFRGQGIGNQLMTRLIEDAKARGSERLLLEMRRGNSAEFLYRRHGFEPVGLRRDYYRTLSGPRIDAITYARVLK